MPNSKQAKKTLRQDDERRVRNKAVRTSMKTAMKKVLDAPSPPDAQAALPAAMMRVDKAMKKAVVHKNKAARIKSRLAKAANKAS